MSDNGWTDAWPAFPSDHAEYQGMSLRDWFAGQCLASLKSLAAEAGYSDEILARRAYEIADAMLKARE